MNLPLLLILISWGGFTFRSAPASPSDHRYNVGDRVPLFVNKVGPLSNPSETYHYYDLPFCSPDPVIQQTESLGEVLGGNRLANTLYELNFRVDKTDTLCEKKLGVSDVAKIRDAVINDFYFQMYYDDLPFWGFIGKVEDESYGLNEKRPKYYMFTHVQFGALYNGNQVIEIHALGDPNHVVDITEDVGINVGFTYSVLWNVTSAQFVNRMDKYSKASFLPIYQQIRRMSFINSTAIILLLIGLLSLLIMRRLKNDMKKYSSVDEEENREVGWKYIHGDVFRHPQNMTLFSAILGAGTQLLTMVCLLFILSFVGILYPYNRGALSTSLVLVYVVTSVVAGYSSASFYSQFAETGWERSVLLTGFLYVGPLFVLVSGLNTIAISYGATTALPFGTIMVILLIYMLVAIPLLALGGIIGYRLRSEFQAPSATKRYPREIPSLSWYRKAPCQMFIASLLSFSSIVLELHHFYATLWGYKVYTLPSILFITFIVLVILTSILSVGLTYIQLSVEDHEWWWRSVLCGGSTAICMFGYCIYFCARSSMHGFLQLSFFIGHNACMCYAIFLILGTISFRVSLIFVRHLYQAVKGE